MFQVSFELFEDGEGTADRAGSKIVHQQNLDCAETYGLLDASTSAAVLQNPWATAQHLIVSNWVFDIIWLDWSLPIITAKGINYSYWSRGSKAFCETRSRKVDEGRLGMMQGTKICLASNNWYFGVHVGPSITCVKLAFCWPQLTLPSIT